MIVGAMIQMQSNRNGDVELFHHSVYHAHYSLITAHILARAFGYAQNYRRVQLLSRLKDRLGPLKVVDVELAYRVVAGFRFLQHFCSRY